MKEIVSQLVVGGGVAGLSLAVILGAFVCLFFWYIIQAVGYWKVFNKAGETGWKALIPIYSTYVRYKLTWDVKMFWISLGLTVVEWAMPKTENFFVSLIGVAASIGALVISIKGFHKLSKAFGHGAGFTVGLFFLEPIFALILGLDGSQYEGIQQ